MSSRSGIPLGNSQLIDGVIHDGLWDIYNNQHMGMCAEKCATDYSISREEQDFYAIESYKRAHKYIESGIFSSEIENVSIPQKRGDSLVVDSDEEPFGVDLEKMSTLRPAFDRKNGTVTAANASSLNDGAAAMVLMSEGSALELGLKPLARVLSSGEAAQDPVDFTTSPSLAVRVASKNAGIDLSDIEYHEINEAFSVVVSIWIDDAYLYIYCF
jgi:acetyl-CoA C-acetyltransferase